MAHYLVELYSPKPAWLALGPEERKGFFDTVGAAMPGLFGLGVEPVALGEIDPGKLYSATQTFYAVWRCPDDAALDALVNGIARSGWHDYFDTINAGGEGTDLFGHLGQLGAVAG